MFDSVKSYIYLNCNAWKERIKSKTDKCQIFVQIRLQKNRRVIQKSNLKNYRLRNPSTTRTLTSLFNYELGEFIHGGLARARVNLEIPVPPGSVFQFPISRNSLAASTIDYFDRLYRCPRCNLSRFSNHRRTNQRGGYEESSPPADANAELYLFLATPSLLPPPPLSLTRRQVNDVKLATIIKLQCRPPAANYRGPHWY